jgi:5-methylcytosine-specific restriction endonuclease McrA
MAVLLINANWLPLTTVSVRRALCLILTDRAEAVVSDESRQWRSVSLSVPEPKVVRLLKMVRVPHRLVPLTKGNVMQRDDHTCQYCGQRLPRRELTIDHVVPRAHGGETKWDNVITACRQCNGRKGDRLPSEAGMTLLQDPQQPTVHTLLWGVMARYGLVE